MATLDVTKFRIPGIERLFQREISPLLTVDAPPRPETIPVTEPETTPAVPRTPEPSTPSTPDNPHQAPRRSPDPEPGIPDPGEGGDAEICRLPALTIRAILACKN